MRIRFTKMQGAGNDFVVLDETRGLFGLSAAQYRWLADRHFGVGADQILSVRAAPADLALQGVDFEYVIHNADGGEVEHCGNGARCFVRYVRDKGLTAKDTVHVKVQGGVIELHLNADGRVTVNMGEPMFALPQVPFDARHAEAAASPDEAWPAWRLDLRAQPGADAAGLPPQAGQVEVSVLSMGNPHAVCFVEDVDTAPVRTAGPLIESHPAFPNRVNAGFLQVLNRREARLRVYERGVGETLACGTGACAAVVAGICRGLFDARVDVRAPGGLLTIEWGGGDHDPVRMTGPATSVFDSEVTVPSDAELAARG